MFDGRGVIRVSELPENENRKESRGRVRLFILRVPFVGVCVAVHCNYC